MPVFVGGKRSTLKKSRKSSKSSKASKLFMVARNKIDKNEDIDKYSPPINKYAIKPKIWELNNRKTFYNWLHRQYSQYESEKYNTTKQLDDSAVSFFRIQKLLRDYMQNDSPFRGLYCYHGLGSGKTCSAIAISAALLEKEEVLFISNASLEKNFIKAIMVDCGPDYLRKSSNWIFVKSEDNVKEAELSKSLGIPMEVIRENNGMFLIDYSNKNQNNFEELTNSNQIKLYKQLEASIRKRFKFLHLDDTRITSRITEGYFDNKIIIVDEAHNLTNRMTSGTKTGIFFYDLFMKVQNSKIIFLSGTPVINNIFEMSKIYNILRGYMPTAVYKLIPEFGKQIQYNIIRNKLLQHPDVDQVFVDKLRKAIKVSKNPDGYVRKDNLGIVKSKNAIKDFAIFKKVIDAVMTSSKTTGGYSKYSDTVEENTCLPEDEKQFQGLFYNYETNKINKPDVLRKRIVGLTSFYENIDTDKFPEITNINIVEIPMSTYQLIKYQPFRMVEIEKRKKQMKRKGADETLQSSYRIYSRLHCTFVFPDEVGSPYDKDNMETYEKLSEILDMKETVGLKDADEIALLERESKKEFEVIEKLSKKMLKVLEQEKDKYLSYDFVKDEGPLAKYAPKYVSIIRAIETSIGCCFVYSQFIEMVGLNTFSIALNATGNYAPLVIIKEDGQYMLDKSAYKSDAEFKKMKKYIFYAGENKDKDLRDILRQIYNSEFDQLPPSCRILKKELEDLYGAGQNLHGEVIKIFLTTRSEGIDLKNIRQIHIMEPYWQPVLIKQIIGRGQRYESHVRLPPDERNLEVFIYLSVFGPDQIKNELSGVIRNDVARFNVPNYAKKGKPITSDQNLYIVAQRKLEMITQAQKLMKDSAFDCTLNYSDNIDNIENKNIVCFDYQAIDRDDILSYLYVGNITDSTDIIEFDQEDSIKVIYNKVEIPRNSKTYYWKLAKIPIGQRVFLYAGDKDPSKLSRMPKPIGEIADKNGKKVILLYKKKKSLSKSKKSLSKSKKSLSKSSK